MKNNSFLVAVMLAFGFNSLQSGQASSLPIRQPEDLLKQESHEDLLKQEARDALYAAKARRHQTMRKVLLEAKPELIAFFAAPNRYKASLHQVPKATISKSSSEDNFYQADYHLPTQEHSLTTDAKKAVIAHIALQTATIIAPSTKRDLSPVRSDEFLGSEDDNEERLESPHSEQPKQLHLEEFQESPSDIAAANDFSNQEIIHHMLND